MSDDELPTAFGGGGGGGGGGEENGRDKGRGGGDKTGGGAGTLARHVGGGKGSFNGDDESKRSLAVSSLSTKAAGGSCGSNGGGGSIGHGNGRSSKGGKLIKVFFEVDHGCCLTLTQCTSARTCPRCYTVSALTSRSCAVCASGGRSSACAARVDAARRVRRRRLRRGNSSPRLSPQCSPAYVAHPFTSLFCTSAPPLTWSILSTHLQILLKPIQSLLEPERP